MKNVQSKIIFENSKMTFWLILAFLKIVTNRHQWCQITIFWWLFYAINFQTYQDDKVVNKSKTIKKLDKIVSTKKLDIMLDIQMADGKIFLVFQSDDNRIFK